jgi:SMI1 / KNR4 family (SUKH-1)
MNSVLHSLFTRGRFAPPATEVQIAAVETTLGLRFPEQLRRLYFECDGFREDLGNSQYLMTLTDETAGRAVLQTTKFWWEEWPQYHPKLDFRPYVFFGWAGGGECWGINWQRPDEIIAYHHHMEDQYEVVGSEIIEVYRAEYAKYEGL